MRFRLGGLAVLLAACSSVSTSYDFDPEADFAKLESYAWLPAPKKDPDQSLVLARIHRATDRVLETKGYAHAGSKADFLLAAHVGSRQKLRVTDWGYSYGIGYGHGGYYGHYVAGPGRIDVYEYEEGSIVLDVVDAKSRKLLWRGVATAVVPDNPKPEQLDKLVDEAVEKVLANFPPPR